MHDSRRTRVVLGLLLVLALALITFDYRDGSSGPVRGLQHFGGSVFGGLERAVSVVTEGGPAAKARCSAVIGQSEHSAGLLRRLRSSQ